MPAKLLLYVSAQQAGAARWRAGQIEWCRELANDQDGWAEFSGLLLSRPGTPVYLLVDAVEEDYRTETLPHTIGNARQEMLARKLRQFYRATPYRAVWPQGRESDKRRDDRYLFAAVTNPELLRPWLEIVQTRQAPLAGIYLLPAVSQQLLAALRLPVSKLLLVSRQSGGLRQSFFQDAKLRVSRLTPLELPGTQAATGYIEEIEKTRFYLNSLRLTSREERLTVCVLDPSGALEDLRRALAQNPGLDCLTADYGRLSRHLGLAPAISATCPNALHLAALGSRPPAVSLAPPALTRGFLHYRVRLVLYALAAAAALVGAAGIGANLYLTGAYHRETRQAAAETRQQEALYLAAARRFPTAPASARAMLEAVRAARAIRGERHTPARMMELLSRVLDKHPFIELDRLRWESGTPAPGRNEAHRLAPDLSQGRQIGYIDAQVAPFGGDYRATLEKIESFAHDLRTSPGVVRVTLLKLPLNVASDSSLAGTTANGVQGSAGTGFRLELVLRRGG